MMAAVSKGLVRYEGKDRILTDDKAPVELLGMKVLDEIIGGRAGLLQGIISGIEADML